MALYRDDVGDDQADLAIREINALQPIQFVTRRETETSVPLVRRSALPAHAEAVGNGSKAGVRKIVQLLPVCPNKLTI